MKKLSLLLLMLMLALALSACFPPVAGTTPPEENPPATDPWDAYDPITIAEALELCGEAGNITTERYYIRATIDTITNATYGAMVISDETGTISVYGTYSADGALTYAEMTDKVYKGDEVLLHCILQNYNGTKEVKNARLIGYKRPQTTVDENDYKAMDIVDARAAATGEKVKLTGVVARITFANGMKPSGFYLVDGTNSIYVYDNDAAQRVKIGNTVTLLGSKTYWILDSEKANAETFGYKGCNQIEDVTLVNVENTSVDFDKSWIPSGTVKDMIETPIDRDVTTSIVKVNALVKKVPGNGFINYRFYDIDGETNSYTYTQCNGSDFAWLDEFDGKICTVYLSIINAKSENSGCTFRLYPVAVADESYTFPLSDAPAYAIKYHAKDQFRASYTGDPALEVVTSVSSELLGFEGVEITYTSSNTAAVYFVTESGKTVMHCGNAGKATVTITATYNGNSVTDSVEIVVLPNVEFDYVSVADAIAAQKGTEVTVKGVVGPSLVNQSGFYLIDDTGVIAVLVPADVFAEIEVGNTVVLKGVRSVKNKGGDSYFGQTYLADGEILGNYYGNTAYCDDHFVTDKTLEDFYNLDKAVDYSTTVFVFEANVQVISTNYYTSLKLEMNGTTISVYCASAGQYQWLQAFKGQTVTIEIAACNWNDKSFWAGCVLSVITDDGKVVNTLNFGN